MTQSGTRLRAVLAAAAWLCLGAAGSRADQFDDLDTRMDALERELTATQAQAKPLLAALATLGERYGDLPGLTVTARERAGLRSVLEPMLAKYARVEQEFNALRASSELQKVAAGFQYVLKSGAAPDNAPAAFIRAQDGLRFATEAQAFRETAAAALRGDDEAFRRAEELAAAAHRRRLLLAGLALGAVFLAALVGLLLRASKLQKTSLAQLVTAPPGGAQAPPAPQAALAGPNLDTLAPGQVLNDTYRIERELGRGGMGVVYGAVDLALNRKVAIKLMQGELARQQDELGLFLSEARLVAQLKHPNLVEIYHIHRENGRLCLIFELVEGHPLSRYLAGGRRLPLAHVKLALRQVASALDYAHSKKVIHRDLKPGNVMVAAGGLVKVMDFGIAYQAKMTVAKTTRANPWGTPAYMAPEQELGRICRESDLFALGVMAYEMLTGRVPFAGPNFLAQKQQGVYDAPTRLAPGLPREADAFLARALAPDAARRFHSADEFAAALEALPAEKASG